MFSFVSFQPDIIGPGEAIIAANTQKDGQLPWNIRSGKMEWSLFTAMNSDPNSLVV